MLFSAAAFAQGTPCTAPPPAPPSLTTGVAGAVSFVPAAVNVVWAGVPFTGPSAVTRYVIEVGSESGQSDIAVAETGGQTVTYSHAAVNGTYYLRVRSKNACGLSGPTGEATVVVTGSPFSTQAAVRPITGTSQVGEDDFGNVMIMGEVSGAWGSPAAAFVKVTGTFTGSNGVALGSEFTYVSGRARRLKTSRIIDDSTVGGAETACYALYTNIPSSTVRGVSISATWSSAALEPLAGSAAVEILKQGFNTVGVISVGGLVRNTGGVTTYFTQVVNDVRDVQNRLLDCSFVSVTGSRLQLPSGAMTQTALAPDQSGPFQFDSRANYYFLDRVLPWASWDEPDAGMGAPASISWRTVAGDLPPEVNDDARERTRARKDAIDKLSVQSRTLDK